MIELELTGSAETELLGAALWAALPAKCLIYLYGDLGAGKTTLVRGLLRAAGYNGTVKSPTYGLVEEYRLGTRNVFHFDLYRLKDPEELEWMGMDDYLQQTALCCIEWPQMGQGLLPPADIEIELSHQGHNRVAKIRTINQMFKTNLSFSWKNKDLLL